MIQPETAKALVCLGAFCSFGLAALGSAIGCGLAAASAIGAWKRCYAQGKNAPFQLTILTGVPMSQTFYGMVLMNSIVTIGVQYWMAALALGILGGLGIGASAAYQGRAAAGACDSFAETNQGFANNLLALGVVETIAIFVMVFGRMYIGKIGG